MRSILRLLVVLLVVASQLVTSSAVYAAESLRLVRGSILHFLKDPFLEGDKGSFQYIGDGMLAVADGKIVDIGLAKDVYSRYPGMPFDDYTGNLIVPGFIDTHIHFPQTEMIASYGEQLLAWLNKYTFPTESQYKEYAHGQKVAKVFLKELLRNGTTTALVFGTVHPQSVDAFFDEASALNMRMIAGKVMMDGDFAPNFLKDTAQSSYDETKALIQRWHGKGRNLYAVTPRFAVTSTRAQLDKAGQLLKEFKDVYMHTHLSENKKEIETVTKVVHKGAKGYLDVYHRSGLTGPHSIFAHGVHLTESEFNTLANTGSAISFCPTSNLFLGSGLFKLNRAKGFKVAGLDKDGNTILQKAYKPVKVGLGTDVGAGTSFSMLQTMNEAYKVVQMQNQKLSAFKALYLATLGSAQALSLDDKLGNFKLGKEADFVVLDLLSTPLMKFRMKDAKIADAEQLAEKAFTLVTLGDDRAVKATYVAGKRVHVRE